MNPPSLTVFDNATGHYETDEHFNQRIAADVRKVTDKITRDGKSAACWVWPYGAANGTSLAIAQKQGYQLAFTRRTGWQTCATSATSRAC